MTTVLVIGAGPAGLAAAVAARERDAAVTLLDSAYESGGQYWRHLPPTRPATHEQRIHHGWDRFTRLRERLESDPRCELLLGAQVWAIEPTGEGSLAVHVLIGPPDGSEREARTFHPDAIVLATGAHERTLPFPGWDLPGVFTGGAAQALAKGERVAVGHNVVVAGAGPFLLPVATSLAAVGSNVRGVFEASRLRSLASGWLPKPWRLLAVPGKGAELAGYIGTHLRGRIPYVTGHAVVAAHGTDRVEAVTVAEIDDQWTPISGTERRIDCDAVCVSHGFTPRLELAVAAGCELSSDRFVIVDDQQRTTIAHVWAAGEITGIGGVDSALAEGQIAGHAAAGGDANSESIRRAVRARSRFSDFAVRIEAAHGIRPGWTQWLTEDTLICRCEEVPYARFREVQAATDGSGLRSVKLTTRAGLGICQARICGRTVEQLLGASTGSSTDRRPIVSPIRVGELAEGDGPTHPQEKDSHEYEEV